MNNYEAEEKEFDENFLNAKYILLNVFLIIEFILIITFTFYIIKTKNNNITKQIKYRLYSFFVIDIFILLIQKYFQIKMDSIPNELLISLLYSFQFLISISYFENISIDFSPIYYEENINPYKECTIFLFIIFSYDKLLLSPPKIINFLQYLILLKFMVKYKDYIINKINEIDIIFEKENNAKDVVFQRIQNFPKIIISFIVSYYCIELLIKCIKYSDIIVGLKIILLILKICNKLFYRSLLITLQMLFEKYFNE